MTRARDELIAEIGPLPFRLQLAAAICIAYHLIGKLEARAYVLGRRPDPVRGGAR